MPAREDSQDFALPKRHLPAYAGAMNLSLRLLTLFWTLCLSALFSSRADESAQPSSRYETRPIHDPNGIGKFYLGREIAHVMGHQGADWLERPAREKEEEPDLMVQLLNLQPGDSVADIGSGTGYISWRLAKQVGKSGKVYGVDIQPEMVDLLAAKMKERGIENVAPVLGTINDPKLQPNSIDLALMVDVYHEFSEPYEMMQAIAKALKPGGRVAFVEFRAEDPNVPIKAVHKMTEAQVKKEIEAIGLKWDQTIEKLPWQHLITFRKPLGSTIAPSGANSATESVVRHRFLCCDYQGNWVAVVAADGSVEYAFTAQTPQDCWMLPNGNVLFCYAGGAMEMSRSGKIAWEYKAPAGAVCHSCQPLPDGNVLVAECGMSRLVEVGRDGKVAKEIKIDSHPKNMGHQFRGTRKTADGHYWVCLMDEQQIAELAADGTLIRRIPVDGFPHEAIKLPDGHLLVTLGQAKRVIELDQKLNIVWELKENDLPGNPLRLPAGCQRLPNGNTIICNYLPGEFMGKQPQAFEVTRDKKVVWEFADHAHFKTVNQIYLLDLPTAEDGDKAGVLR